MSVLGKWRIMEMPDYTDDYLNMMGPAYILFEPTRGEFAFGCVTGAFSGGGGHGRWSSCITVNMDQEGCGSGISSTPRSVAVKRAPFHLSGQKSSLHGCLSGG